MVLINVTNIKKKKLTYSAFVTTLDCSGIVNALVNDNKASQIIFIGFSF